MDQEEYLKTRVDDQISWYSHKSAVNKRYTYWMRGLVIVFSAAIPFLSGYAQEDHYMLPFIIGVLGALIAIATGLTALMKFQEKWIEYRTTTEALKQERYLFLTQSGPYDRDDNAFKKFVARIEQLLNKELSTWNHYINKEE